MSAKPRLGSGQRFTKLAAALASKPDVRDPDAMAASIGRRKLGAAKFNALAQAGRNRKPPPDVFERRATRETNRKLVDANTAAGRTYGGSYTPSNPYGKGPPAGGSDAAGNMKTRK